MVVLQQNSIDRIPRSCSAKPLSLDSQEHLHMGNGLRSGEANVSGILLAY